VADGRQFALQIRIGAFILAGLAVFVAIIYLLGAQARYFEPKYDLIAQFTEVGGLMEGATVRLAGVQVGRVTEVVLPPDPDGKVRVTLTIARRFSDRIRRDSEVRIATQGLLGDKIIEITLGSPAAPALQPGEMLTSKDSFEMQQMFKAGVETLQTVRELAASLKGTAERVDRIAKEVETGKGLVHTLVYGEPEALGRLNALLLRTQNLIARAEQGDNAVGVLLSPESGKSMRSLLAAMDALSRTASKLESRDNLISALLYDPQYKAVADDLRAVAHNFRDVSERVAQGQGLLGQLTRDGADGAGGSLGEATTDFRIAMANLRAVTERLKAGEGTVGALLEDPTVYENLVQFLEGARRSFLLRTLIRSTIESGSGTGAAAGDGR
jgi:phospholipid/cholesterol/gamma-HCH transport system substrate-binding protein